MEKEKCRSFLVLCTVIGKMLWRPNWCVEGRLVSVAMCGAASLQENSSPLLNSSQSCSKEQMAAS